jgi:hypothetical protein
MAGGKSKLIAPTRLPKLPSPCGQHPLKADGLPRVPLRRPVRRKKAPIPALPLDFMSASGTFICSERTRRLGDSYTLNLVLGDARALSLCCWVVR